MSETTWKIKNKKLIISSDENDWNLDLSKFEGDLAKEANSACVAIDSRADYVEQVKRHQKNIERLESEIEAFLDRF